MSFTRADYERIYRFARQEWMRHRHRASRSEVLPEAARIMDMVEEVIGQQSDRPQKSRNFQHVGPLS